MAAALPPVLAVPTEPGIYQGLGFADYHQIEAVNHSSLEGFRRSPAHAREEMLHPSDSTAALALGHAFHTFVLEPERFAMEYVVPPKVDRRTREGKATWASFEQEYPNHNLLKADEVESYKRMAAALGSHPTASELLTGKGANELTIVWRDEATGLLCKGRIDRVSALGGVTFISDLKTTKDARERSFSKDAGDYGYFRAISWYRRGLATLRPALRRCAFIAVEKEPPYAVACHEADERALEQGDREMTAYLAKFKECVETGQWPAYDAGLGLIDYPAWQVDQV